MMKNLLILAGCAAIFSTARLGAAEDAPKMIVEPSATTVKVARANLVVSPLEHQEQAYLGSYQLKVTPFSFKSEKGTLLLDASDETVRKMTLGKPVEFSGKAKNAQNGTTKVVTGKATPSGNDRGEVTFSVQTDNGTMVFNTSYHLVKAE